MENSAKKMFETMTNMQKQAMDNFTQMNETIQKNMGQSTTLDSDFFKKWYDSQMSFFNQSGEKTENSNPMNFFNTWMNNQLETARNWFDQSQNAWHSMSNGNTDAKATYDQSMNMFNNWMNTMNGTYSEMLKNFNGNADAKHSFEGMFNNAQNYLKMYELWMPAMKAMQNKSFTPDMFKNMFNFNIYKDMMDNMFSMQPDFMKNMNGDMMKGMKENMNKAMEQGKSMYDSMKNNMTGMMPSSNENFDQLYNYYNSFYNTMNNAAAPLMKMMTPGKQKDQMEMMGEMAHEMALYNMKNSQMQYMMYVTGIKAQEEVANHMYEKMQSGEEINNFMNVYQEWLNTNDKVFVGLFDSEEYSKMQSELHSLGMRLKRKIDLQMEKSFENLPLINRTEMDSLYKTVQDMKKRISDLQKQILEMTVAATAPVSAPATEPVAETKTATKKAGKTA
jgi:hypothetical protein